MLTFRERSTSTKCEIDRHSRLIAGDQKLVGTTAIPKPTGSQIERGSLYPALHRLEARGWSSTDKPKSAPSNSSPAISSTASESFRLQAG
jgi:Transcriptional regulator PadR-like family